MLQTVQNWLARLASLSIFWEESLIKSVEKMLLEGVLMHCLMPAKPEYIDPLLFALEK